MNLSFLKLIWLCLFISFSLLTFAQRITTATGNVVTPSPSETGDNLCDKIGLYLEVTNTIGKPNITGTAGSINFASQIPFLSGGNVYNQNISVYGKLIVDIDLFIVESNFIMETPDCEIEIVNNKGVSAINSNFFSCYKMWKGFYVQPNCKLAMLGCGVEDAEKAILADNNSILNIWANKFNRNYIGITNNNSGSNTFTSGYFMWNVFDCTMPLRIPRSSEYSYAGMILERCSASFGTIGASNIFQNLRNGVISNNSSANLTRFKIQNLRENTSVGILANDGTLNINGDDEEIKNCGQSGIEGHGANLDIYKYNFSGNQVFGVNSYENFNYENVRVTNNELRLNHSNNLGGIYLERSLASGPFTHCIISYDTLHLDQATNRYFGISVDQPNYAYDLLRINNNSINFNASIQGMFGIMTGNFNGNTGTKVIDNNINFLNPSTFKEEMYGILYTNNLGLDNQVSHNSIFSSGSTKSGENGIRLEDTPQLLVCDNRTGGTDKGIYIEGNCEPMFLKSNQMFSHNWGLFIDDSDFTEGKIGVQNQHGNTWLTVPSSYTNFAAANEATDYRKSRFLVDNDFSRNPSNVNPAFDWFKTEPGTPNFSCALLPIPPPFIGDSEQDLMALGVNSISSNPRLQWESVYTLYYKLLTQPDLVSNNLLASNFLSGYSQHSAARFAAIKYQINEAMKLPALLQTALDNNANDQTNILTQLRQLDNTLVGTINVQAIITSPTAIDNLLPIGFIQSKQGFLNQLQNLNDAAGQLQQQANALRLQNLQALITAVGNLPDAATWEQAYKTLFGIRLKKYLGQTISTTDVANVRTIANDCPEAVGSAKRVAQQMLSIKEELQHRMQAPCPQQRESQKSSLKEIKLLPNPASTEVLVQTVNNCKGYEVLTIDGNVKLHQDLGEPSSSFTLNISSLEGAIYMIKLEFTNGEIATKQLVVIK